MLEVASLIIARAATPISWVDSHQRRPAKPRAATAKPAPPRPEPPPEAVAEQSEPNRATVEPQPASPRPATPQPASPQTAPKPQPQIATAPARPERPRRFEIGARALWSFPVDGPPSGPVGEIELGYRWSRLGVSLRAGVAQDWSASADSPAGSVTLSARRVTIAAELHIDLRVPRGAFRIGLAPVAEIWITQVGGAAPTTTTVFAEPALALRAAYGLDLGRFGLALGVDLTGVLAPEGLSIEGVGRVAKTSAFRIAPYLGGVVRL
jgi:hypothetical protein